MNIPSDIREAVVGFVIDLRKGLMEDERWDWDIDRYDYQEYLACFNDTTILTTTLSVFLNTLQVNDKYEVVNYEAALFRGFQYFRARYDPSGYPFDQVVPPFTEAELQEPPWG